MQSVRISLATATTLNLITLDVNNKPVVNTAAIGSSITIDPAAIVPEPSTTQKKQHPVGSALSNFFFNLTGVNYDMIMNSHNNGFGFGVIAQALWMTSKLGGDTSLFTQILDAKRSGDYSQIALPDGSIPQNWGQLKKALIKGSENGVNGAKPNGNNNDQGKDNNNGNDNTNGNPNGKPSGNGNGNNKNEPGK